MGQKEESIIQAPWPKYDSDALKKDSILIVVQVNGKLRGKFEVPAGSSEDEIKKLVLANEKIQQFCDGKDIRKFIYIPGRLVNIVV